MGTLTLDVLATDASRASLMFDYSTDPRGLIADLLSAVSEAGYPEGTAIPESLCGPLSATVGAAMLYEVYQRVTATGGEVTAYDYAETQTGAQTLMHAAYDHGDAFAQSLIGAQFPEVIDRIEAWVLDNLTADLDNVVELFASVEDFDAWEAETSEPEPTTTA